MRRGVSAVLIAAAFTAACGSSGSGVTARFAGSDAAVTDATVTPLIGSRDAGGTLLGLVPDPNGQTLVTDGAGRFQIDGDQLSAVSGLQITISVPSTNAPATGRLDWRTEVDQIAEDPDGNLDGIVLEVPEPRPCADAQSCGLPRLPDLQPIIASAELSAATATRLEPSSTGSPTAGLFPADTWFVSDEEGRRLLRFATVAANLGDGPLDVIAEPGADGSARTWQRVWTDSWHFEDHLSGEFVFHPTHDHVHFDAFERYRLLDANGSVVAASEKVSFCLRDSVRLSEELPPVTGPMLADDGACDGNQQVINAGFGDHYHALLDDQWIDVTGVPPGSYLVEITVDPLNLILESDESNNSATFPVELE